MKSERYFFIPQRPENQPATDRNVQKIDKGSKIATNFKGSNISSSNIEPFYQNPGKKLPPQLEMRSMNPLTNHWEGPKEHPDYEVRKMKEDMKAERVRKIKQGKRCRNLKE